MNRTQKSISVLLALLMCMTALGTMGISFRPTQVQAEAPAAKAGNTFDPSKYAMVTLRVDDIWNNGTGYQMYLDKEANTCGEVYYSGNTFCEGDMDSNVYNKFEYKIPQSASGKINDKAFVCGGESTIIVPSGTYDYAILNLDTINNKFEPPKNLPYYGYVGGTGDNFDFSPYLHYIFTVSKYDSKTACVKVTTEDLPDDPVVPTEVPPTAVPVTGFKEITWSFEENPFTEGGWTLKDEDGDNKNWVWSPDHIADNGGKMPVYDGEGIVYSESKGCNPNNWLISPKFVAGGSVTAHLVSVSGGSEHAEILISEDGNNWTLVREVNPRQSYDDFDEYKIDTLKYMGKEIQIAFRHCNSGYVYKLVLDCVQVNAYIPPTDTPAPTATPTPAAATATPRPGDDIVWDFDDNYDPFLCGWTREDKDKDGFDWYWVNDGYSYNGFSSAYNGRGCMVSDSFHNEGYVELNPDNWLISPTFTAGDRVSAMIRSLDTQWFDNISVYIRVEGGNWIEKLWFTAENKFEEHSIDTKEYKGKKMQLLFRHHNSSGRFALILDHIVVDMDYVAPPTSVPTAVPTNTPVPTQSPAPNPNKATVILRADEIWNDGSGYALLLDKDANTYGKAFNPNDFFCRGDIPQSLLQQFEYKIPTNFDGKLNTQNVVRNQAQYITVDPGYYDYAAINNDSSGVWFFVGADWGNIYGTDHNLRLEAGNIYEFYIHQHNDANGGKHDTIDLYVNGQYYDPDVPVTPVPTGDVATIILTSDSVFKEDGYIMLLDEDANTYDKVWDPSEPFYIGPVIPDDIFGQFEYTIPQGANNNVLEPAKMLMSGETATIVIPAGTYDFTFINPVAINGGFCFMPDNCGYIESSVDNFEFEAGRTYRFHIRPMVVGLGDTVDCVDIIYDTETVLPANASVIKAWDFETDPKTQGWTTEDNDHDGRDWNWVPNASQDGLPAFDGKGVMASYSYLNETSTALKPNNWLISPEFVAGDYIGAQFSSLNPLEPENIGVYVSVDNGEWKLMQQKDIRNSLGDFLQIVIDTREYAGRNIRVAYRHFESDGRFILVLDRVAVYNADGAGLPGDCDGNGNVDTTDAVQVLRGAMELIALNDDQKQNCDMDKNGRIDMTDAITVLRMALGLVK